MADSPTTRAPASTEPGADLLHGTLLAFDGLWGAAGVLLRGASGVGKSDLALRAIEARVARLVGDDHLLVERRGDRLFAGPPPALAGLLEVRGIGVMRLRPDDIAADSTAVDLVVDLDATHEIERMPDAILPCPRLLARYGVSVPRFWVNPLEASAIAKLAVAAGITCGILRRAD